MHLYFSHSYRDIAVNSYFLEHFLRADFPLRADRKSDVWCVAKLERYLFEANGFISVIPRRASAEGAVGYSEYIGQELSLARRARVPRLLFVDESVLQQHDPEFPDDAIGFDPLKPEIDYERHERAIKSFANVSAHAVPPLRGVRLHNVAAVIADDAVVIRTVAHEVYELLARAGFTVTSMTPGRYAKSLDNVQLLEALWRCELCVFLLGTRVSETHLALALAHAHCIPSIRLQFDRRSEPSGPTLTGSILWQSQDQVLTEFKRQLASFRRGFVQPIEIAKGTGVRRAAQDIATPRWDASEQNLWSVNDGSALIQHVNPNHPWVQDETDRARHLLRTTEPSQVGRARSEQICRTLYDGLKRLHFYYEFEPQIGDVSGRQKVRSPDLIVHGRSATCIDVCCLFAALLEAANQNPVIVVLRGPGFSHALCGFRMEDEPELREGDLGSLRRAQSARDIVLFEATGAVESDLPVGAEDRSERREKLLDFTDSVSAASRMLLRDDVTLLHAVDVRALRRKGT
jgi:hypothetical protein